MIHDAKWDRKSVDQKLADARAELEADIARWHDIYEHGCSDPFWPDGVNLDLKRNHIINDLRVIAELEKKPCQLSLFSIGEGPQAQGDWRNDPCIPPKVPQDYMATDRKCNYFYGKGGPNDPKKESAA